MPDFVSIWRKKAATDRIKFKSLDKDIKTDVLIVGGGMTGILCAYMLSRVGIKCTVAEASHICSGVTGNSTAKITLQHGLIYSKIADSYGIEYARAYMRANLDALEMYENICRENEDIPFERRDFYVYSRVNAENIKMELEALSKLNCGYEFDLEFDFVPDVPLPFKTAGALRIRNQAQINPLEFVYKLADKISKKADIYENTLINKLEGRKAICEHGSIEADKIIIASHFPFINKHGMYFIKLYQNVSYVLALENAADVNGMYIDETEGGLSFRNYGNILLLGGGSHRTGKKSCALEELRASAALYYPNAEITAEWTAQDCMPLDGHAYIGRYSKNTPDIYTATGFNKWGMTMSMYAAIMLTGMIHAETYEENDLRAKLFSPSRHILHRQLAVNIFESVMNILTPKLPRCPHMGCALKYNEKEHTWDCPCHGSRFTSDGKLEYNPALHGINKHIRRKN